MKSKSSKVFTSFFSYFSAQSIPISYAEKEYLNEEKPRSRLRVKADEQSSLSVPKSQGLTQFRCRNVICGHCNSTKNYPGSRIE